MSEEEAFKSIMGGGELSDADIASLVGVNTKTPNAATIERRKAAASGKKNIDLVRIIARRELERMFSEDKGNTAALKFLADALEKWELLPDEDSIEEGHDKADREETVIRANTAFKGSQ